MRLPFPTTPAQALAIDLACTLASVYRCARRVFG